MRVLNIFVIAIVNMVIPGVTAGIPQHLKEQISARHDPATAASLQNALERVGKASTAEAAQRAAKDVIASNDEEVTAWLLAQPKLSGNAVIALKSTTPAPGGIRAVCAAIRKAAPADDTGVFVEGDADDPGLIVANLKELFDWMIGSRTAGIERGSDGQYHKGNVDHWLAKAASQIANQPEVRSDLKSAVRDYVTAAKLMR